MPRTYNIDDPGDAQKLRSWIDQNTNKSLYDLFCENRFMALRRAIVAGQKANIRIESYAEQVTRKPRAVPKRKKYTR